jgi:hypothetical protein
MRARTVVALERMMMNETNEFFYAPIHPGQPSFSLNVTGTEAEVRSCLDGPRLARVIADLNEALRDKLETGHDFDGTEALWWVRERLAEGKVKEKK